jgi:hypothetical protein
VPNSQESENVDTQSTCRDIDLTWLGLVQPCLTALADRWLVLACPCQHRDSRMIS